MTLLTLLHSCMPYRFRSRKWDWLSGQQWSGWKTIMISISLMVFDKVGPLEARTSKFGGVTGARRRPPPAQPVKTTSGHCRVLRFYFVFLLQKSEEVIFFTDPVPPSTNQYRPKLTQYHHVSTITAFYWPSTIIYQPVPLHTDPVSPSINPMGPGLV